MWGDPDTAIGGNRDRFPSTQVSLIAAAAGEPLAMERVVALYWKPVYKFIRFKFHVNSTQWGIVVGSVLGLAFAFAVAAMPSESGHHYVEIMAPGFVVGAIIGFLTQKMGTPVAEKRSSYS